jgi:hypothetical protein
VLSPVLAAQTTLPPLNDGVVVAGPGKYRHDGELRVQGKVTLRNLDIDLRGPIRVAAGSTFELDNVRLTISDPPGAQNGSSGLDCDGPAHIIVRNSTMGPAGSAHPMWRLQGQVEIDNFQTVNSEFHLNHVTASLRQFKIFELEISNASQVKADGLDLVFLSTHSSDDDRLQFADIPADTPFSKRLVMGSQASADLRNTRLQMFLLYVHGQAQAELSHMGRVQLAMFPKCKGTMRLPQGQVGSDQQPVTVPEPGASDCGFRFTLKNVNVDTWDVYASDSADLTFRNSRIDELNANDHAKIDVRDSVVYADWLGIAGNAQVTIENSTVGALSLAKDRPDLATSEIHLSGNSHSSFSGVRFDCGIVARDEAKAEISGATTAPQYVRQSGRAVVHMDGVKAGNSKGSL